MRYILPYLSHLKSCKPRLIMGILMGLAYGALSGLGIPYFVGEVFKNVFESSQAHSVEYVVGITALLPLVFLVRGLTGYANQYLMNYCAHFILLKIRKRLFDKINSLQLAFFDKRNSGDLMSRLSTDTLLIQATIMEVANEVIRQPATAIAALGGLIFLSYQHEDVLFLFLLIGVMALMIAPLILVGKNLKYRGKQFQEGFGEVMQHMHENLNAATEVRAYNLEEREHKRFGVALDHFFNVSIKLVKYEKIMQPLMELLGALVVAICFAYAYATQIPFNVISKIGFALYFCIDSIKRFVKVLNNVQKHTGAFQRVTEIFDEEETIKDPLHPLHVKNIRGDIQLQNVGFSYDETPILSDINLNLKQGTVCALVGPSGGGKSTLAKLIPRLYEVCKGTLTIDGEDIKAYSMNFLREHIAVVSQKPVLFNDTIFENIKLGKPDATESEVYTAARAAYADDFIKEQPQGYQTMVGEDGARLSGGQRQRIAIARAFLRNAPILIMDEATSALDSESEAKIQRALETLVKGKTTLIIAHRFSTVKLANTIVVMNQGRIVAQGTHDELYQQNLLYKSLYDQQQN